MSDAQVTMNLSKEIIDAHVKAAVASVLNKDPAALVKAVVDAAMRQPAPNTYRGETIWDLKVFEMIHAVANQTFNEWLDEMKPTIAKEVRARLAGKNGRKTIDDIVEKLSTSLENFHVSISINR